MRLITFKHNGCEQIGLCKENKVIPLSAIDAGLPADMRQLLASGQLGSLSEKADQASGSAIALDDVEYLPVVADPGKIICIGRNYAAHAAEGGAATPTFPEIFMRSRTSLVAHRGNIIRPQCSTMLDYEGEIAFVIGQRCRHATEENALTYVAGYTLFNDATLRDYQRFSSQWTIGKNFDATGAFGPELVTADELPDGIEGLTLRTTLNDELMQEGHTDDLVFPVRKLMTILSECMTLEPGDVIVTGTPSGVGFARKPPVWMKAGDTVEVAVAGIGKLVNTVQDAE